MSNYTPYEKTQWVNDQTKLSSKNMNHIEDGIKNLEDYTIELDESKQEKLTDSQLSAVNSGINATKVANYDNYATSKQDVITDLAEIRLNAAKGKTASDTIATYGNIVTHNTSEFATASQGAKADSAYQKPSAGIPKTDLEASVQESLNKADTAIQEHQSLAAYSTTVQMNGAISAHHDASKQDKLIAGSNVILNNNTISAIDTKYTAGTNISISADNVISSTTSEPEAYIKNATVNNEKLTLTKKDDSTVALDISNKANKTDLVNKLETYQVTVEGAAGTYKGEANVPVCFEVAPEADKAIVKAYNIKLNTTKEQTAQVTQLDIPSATSVSAGLLSATNKNKYDSYETNKQDKLSTVQINATNSGITESKVSSYDTHINNSDIHVTTEEKAAWNVKYDKPETGIPKTDLASSVQISLGKADSAVQPEAGKGLFSGNYNDLANKPNIPTKTSELTNDSGFLTEHQDISGKLDKPNEPAVGQGVNVPYYFDVKYEDNKVKVTDYTIDLLNKDKDPQQFNIDITAATKAQAGLMSAADKIKLEDTTTRVDNLESRGRFLSIWNAELGRPNDLPIDIATKAYTFKTGDYYIVGTIGKKMPTGTSLPAGTTIENFPSIEGSIDEAINDTTYFNGNTWALLQGTVASVTWDSITGKPTEFPPAVHEQSWSTITDTPNSLSGYGINDAYNKTEMDSALAGKQASLTDTQILATNSGITSEKVSTFDNYSTTKQDTLTESQLTAINSGITSTEVQRLNSAIDLEGLCYYEKLPVLTWDGDTTGRPSFKYYDEEMYYLISTDLSPLKPVYDESGQVVSVHSQQFSDPDTRIQVIQDGAKLEKIVTMTNESITSGDNYIWMREFIFVEGEGEPLNKGLVFIALNAMDIDDEQHIDAGIYFARQSAENYVTEMPYGQNKKLISAYSVYNHILEDTFGGIGYTETFDSFDGIVWDGVTTSKKIVTTTVGAFCRVSDPLKYPHRLYSNGGEDIKGTTVKLQNDAGETQINNTYVFGYTDSYSILSITETELAGAIIINAEIPMSYEYGYFEPGLYFKYNSNAYVKTFKTDYGNEEEGHMTETHYISSGYVEPSETNNQVLMTVAGETTWADLPQASVSWGNISGTLSSQTDLQSALDNKQTSLTTSQLTAVNSGITAEQVTNLKSAFLNKGIGYKTTGDGKRIFWDGETTELTSASLSRIDRSSTTTFYKISYLYPTDITKFIGKTLEYIFGLGSEAMEEYSTVMQETNIIRYPGYETKNIFGITAPIPDSTKSEVICWVFQEPVSELGISSAGIWGSRLIIHEHEDHSWYFINLVWGIPNETFKIDADMVDDTESTNQFVNDIMIDRWDSKSVVSASSEGESTDEISYITIDETEYKIKQLSEAGATNKPVYISADGVASECNFTIDKSVPSDAKFTDTTYSAGTNVSITNNIISATDTTYTSGNDGIAISGDNKISNTGVLSVNGNTGTITGIATTEDLQNKQNKLTASTGISIDNNNNKISSTGFTYLTEAPTSDNNDGLKVVVLNSEPTTRYNGYLYIITITN